MQLNSDHQNGAGLAGLVEERNVGSGGPREPQPDANERPFVRWMRLTELDAVAREIPNLLAANDAEVGAVCVKQRTFLRATPAGVLRLDGWSRHFVSRGLIH